eukprot:c5010_g1_i1.p1 GENE.c5010_g1_i1~~c5010_g1_i1.p1  ORF type:complete len:1372 (+),score=409.54 c5010_g1_i1:2-4117(+)
MGSYNRRGNMFSSNLNIQHVNQIKKAIKVMQLFANFGDVEGQIQCSVQLGQLAAGGEGNCEMIREEGGLKLICGLLLQPKDDAQLQSARALTHLAKIKAGRGEMVELDVFVALGRMLKSSDQELTKASAKCLEQLLRDSEMCKHQSVINSGVIPNLCNMVNNINNVEALPDAALCMQYITATESLRGVFGDSGGISSLVHMSDGAPALEVSLPVAAALGNLSTDAKYGRDIVDGGGVPVIVRCLEHWAPEVKSAALQTLNNLKTDSACDAIATSPDGFELVMRCANRKAEPPNTEEVYSKALDLILTLASHISMIDRLEQLKVLDMLLLFATSSSDKDNVRAAQGFARVLRNSRVQRQFMAKDKPYLEALFQLGSSSSNPEVHEFVALALLNLCNSNNTNSNNEPELVSTDRRRALLLRYGMSSDMGTRRNTAQILSKIAHSSGAIHLGGNEALKVLIDMTRSRDEVVFRFGALAISAVAFTAGNSSTNIAVNGGLRTLIQFGYSKNQTMQTQAATALGSIALNSKISDQLLDEGGLQLLERLCRSPHPDVLAAARKAKSNYSAMQTLGNLALYASITDVTALKGVDERHSRDLIEQVSADHVSPDVIRVGLTALANLNLDKRCAAQCLKTPADVEMFCKFIDPSIASPGPEFDVWRDEIVVQAVRALGNGAHEEQQFKSIAQHPESVSCLVKQLAIGSTKHATIHIEVCNTITRLARSELIRKRFFAEQGLEPTIVLLNSRNDDVKIAAAGVLAALATDEKSCERILKDRALSGVVAMLLSLSTPVSRQGAYLLSRLAVATKFHNEILLSVKWSVMVQLLEHDDSDIRVAIANTIALLAQNAITAVPTLSKEQQGLSPKKQVPLLAATKDQLAAIRQGMMDSGALPLLVKMSSSGDVSLQLASAGALAVLASYPPARAMLRTLDLMATLASMARSPNLQVRQAAAEVLANFVETDDAEGGGEGSHLLDKTTLGGLVELVHAGTVPLAKSSAVENARRAARALAQVSKSYEGKMRIAEMKGIGALIALAAIDDPTARLDGVRVLAELSVVTSNQVEIVTQGGLAVLLDLTVMNSHHTDEAEEFALKTIANLAINAENKAKLDRPEVKQRLDAIARALPDPAGDAKVHASKTKLAQRALNNMLSSRLLAKLSNDASWFGGGVTADDVRAILSLLQNSENAAVGCEVARALGNIAEKGSNMNHILTAGAVEAIAQLLPSPDPQVQMLASRAVALFALHPDARRLLTDQKATTSLCRLLNTTVPRSLTDPTPVAVAPAPSGTGPRPAEPIVLKDPSRQRKETIIENRDTLLFATRALANLCVLPELPKNTIIVVRENTIHPLVLLVAHSQVDAELRYEAARVLASLNHTPAPTY